MKHKTYFKHLLELVKLEQEAEKAQIEQVLASMPMNERVENGITWYPLRIHDWYYDNHERLVLEVNRVRKTEVSHEFSTGNLVSIYRQDNTGEDLQCSGTVMAIRGDQAKIAMNADEFPEWLRHGKLGMNLLYDETSFREMVFTLKQLIQTEDPRLSRRIKVLLGEETAEFDVESDVASANLNPAQNNALSRAISARDVFLVHGPPGTGKTTTLLEIIKQSLETHSQILVCAASNNAVDLLVDKLRRNGVEALRIGNPARVNDHILPYSLSQQLTDHPDFPMIRKLRMQAREYRDMASKYKRQFGHSEREQRRALFNEAHNLNKEAQQLEEYIQSSLLDKAQVIAATLVGSAHHSIRDKHYSLCIIDEASQALEPAAWIPVLRSDKVIMAGDHKQLPPTVKSSDADKAGLSTSLFEKLMRKENISALLNRQYRMHAEIMAFPNSRFYGNKLEAAAEVMAHGKAESPRFRFIDTAGCGFQEKLHSNRKGEVKGVSNPEEADLCAKRVYQFCEWCIENRSNVQNIGVISPYRAQVEYLKELLSDLPFPTFEISVNTVDGFQGQERDAIFISLVRSNDRNEIGFLKDYRRMNVALTRAKYAVQIIGDSATLANDSFYNEMVGHAEKIGGYHSAWEFITY